MKYFVQIDKYVQIDLNIYNLIKCHITNHWQGNLTLPISLWVNGTIIAIIVALLTTHAVDEIYQSDLSDKAWLIATIAVFSLSIMMSVWAIIGIWRSATSHQRMLAQLHQ
jgi:hypothetical protein